MMDRYLEHLSEEENKMLDIIADIVVGHIMRRREEQKNKTDMPHPELNQYCADSESIVRCKKTVKKKALDFQALSV